MYGRRPLCTTVRAFPAVPHAGEMSHQNLRFDEASAFPTWKALASSRVARSGTLIQKGYKTSPHTSAHTHTVAHPRQTIRSHAARGAASRCLQRAVPLIWDCRLHRRRPDLT